VPRGAGDCEHVVLGAGDDDGRDVVAATTTTTRRRRVKDPVATTTTTKMRALCAWSDSRTWRLGAAGILRVSSVFARAGRCSSSTRTSTSSSI